MLTTQIPLFIGFRLLNTPEPMVGFGCTDCLMPHVHPDDGAALQRFASVCPDSERQADQYDLLIVGSVPGPRDLPFPAEDDEVADLNRLLAAIPR